MGGGAGHVGLGRFLLVGREVVAAGEEGGVWGPGAGGRGPGGSAGGRGKGHVGGGCAAPWSAVSRLPVRIMTGACSVTCVNRERCLGEFGPVLWAR